MARSSHAVVETSNGRAVFVGPPNDAAEGPAREASRGAGSQRGEELSPNGQSGYRACARLCRRHAAGVPVQAPRRQRRAGRRAAAAAEQREGPVPFEVVRRRYGDRGRRLGAACGSADARAAVDGPSRAVDRSDRGRGPGGPSVRLHGAAPPVDRRRHDGTRPDRARRNAPLAGRGARDVRRADADRLRSRHAGPGDHARRRSASGGAVASSRRCARSGGGRTLRRVRRRRQGAHQRGRERRLRRDRLAVADGGRRRLRARLPRVALAASRSARRCP